jgi:hypothetical protein
MVAEYRDFMINGRSCQKVSELWQAEFDRYSAIVLFLSGSQAINKTKQN